MEFRRPVLAATLLLGCVIPLVMPASSALAAPVRSLCAPPADTVGPAVTKVSFGRATISLNSKARTQTVKVTAVDTSGSGRPSGVSRVFLDVQGKRFGAAVRLKLASGTRAAGTWAGRFTISKYAHAGTYSINYLTVTDAAGNEQEYSGYGKTPDGPNALSLHPGDDPSFTVTGTPAKRPVGKPAGSLSGFSFSPNRVNTTAAAHLVRFTATFTGAAPRRVFVYLNTSNTSSGSKLRYVFLRAVLHDEHGVWTGTARVPRWLGHQVLKPMLQAYYGNGYRPSGKGYDAERLQDLHFPTELTVVSGVDKTKPTLTALAFSPRSIDSTGGPVKVTVTARARDTASGVRSIDVNGSIRNGINGAVGGLYPFAAAGVGYVSSNYFHVRLKKTASGKWVGTTIVRRCVPSGTYKLEADVNDYAGNYHYLSTKQLAKARVASTVHVTSQHGDVAAPYVYSAATYVADSELLVDFSEGVSHVSTSTLSVFPLSPASTRFTKPATVTSLTCANGKAKIDCSGADGLVTSAVLVVPSLKPGLQYQVYANLNQVTPQLVDGNRNPLQWNYAASEVKGS